MKKPELDNKTLDQLARQLICRSVPSTDEIENLIGDPNLFDRVLAKIGSNDCEPWYERPSIGLLSGSLRRDLLKLCVGFAVVVVAIWSGFSFRTARPLAIGLEARFPDSIPGIARSVSPPKFPNELSPGRATFSDIASSEARHPVKTVYHPPRTSDPIENDGEFYELSVGSDPNGTFGDSRIVRVDIKRSSLLALGVNLPLENESETVRADLLVGPDGVTRAFRLVK